MISGKYKEELLSDYANFEKSSSFREIKEISHVCTWKVKKGNTGSAFYTTMLESPHPHVYLTDTKQETEEDIKFVEEYYQTIPHLLHLEEDATFATLPVRWALVYSGTKANTLSVEKQKKLTTSQNTNYSEWFLVQDFEKIHSHLHELFTHKNYYEILEDGLDEMSAKLLYLFAHIYKQGPRKEHITALIHTLNTLNYLYNNVEEDADFYDEFLEACVATQTSPTKF
ncbi:MAG: hypothetical protein LBO09_03940 [Candidatus Peribacteria bacterium]|jgi:hypothetical protein|nr:hypothetical protein [Candidatus Peribacteria bacterium]